MHNIDTPEIRRVLAKLYDGPDRAKLVAEDIGLQLARISFSYPMEICWSNIWREAKLQHQELNLIDRALVDYPKDEQLTLIRHQIIEQQEQSPPGGITEAGREKFRCYQRKVEELKSIHNMLHNMLHEIEAQLSGLSATMKLNIKELPRWFIIQRPTPSELRIIEILWQQARQRLHYLGNFAAKEMEALEDWYRKALAYRAIIVICLIVICIPLSFWRYSTINTGVGLLSPDDPRHIGVCDGSCIFDRDRPTGKLKQKAADYFQQKQDTFACQYLRWAALGAITGPETTNPVLNDARSQAEDTTDAEAKIDYENRCTEIQCPCISFVVVVQFIDQHNPNADYINGMSRSILQGAYLQQKKWNRSHSNGPKMYLFIANVSPDTLQEQGPELTQQEVAAQILQIQQRDQDHIIVGVVGLPFGTNTLADELNNAQIPMVSTAPLVSSNSKPYLFSVAPSLDDEVNKVVNFCSKFPNIQYYYDQTDDYSRTFTGLFRDQSKHSCTINPILPYSENITSLANQVAASDSDVVIFIGPPEDTANFLIQLRKKEKAQEPHTVLAGDNLYQWVYKYFKPDKRLAFDNVHFVAFAYPDPTHLPIDPHSQDTFTNMLHDFNNTFDPGDKRSGNIYTYHWASSDAILAYDALSLLINAQKNTTCTILCDTSIWEETLQHYVKFKPFKGVSGQISFISGSSAPNNKYLFFLTIDQEKNGNPQDFSGRY